MSLEEEIQTARIDATVLLADAAQVSDGKLFVLGGGLQVVAARPQPVSLALLIHVPWDRAGIRHDWRLELLDEDGLPVRHSDAPILVQGTFEANRLPGRPPGTPIVVPLAINFSALPVQAERRYTWRLVIDGTTEPRWQVSFSVAPLPTATA